MCCLKNEEETYEFLNSRLPGIGDFVTADDGLKGEVQSVNVLLVIFEYNKAVKKKEKVSIADKELKQLEALERKEGKSKLNDE